jgi:anti-sigma28 factor (negative regulator of flagellin synthesis)
MNTINSIGPTDPVQRIANNPIQMSTPAGAADAATPTTATDRLELSGVSYLYQALQANNIRTDKVAAVRSQIEAGTYEDEQKLNVTVDKLLDDLTK